MKRVVFGIMILAMISVFSQGCGSPPDSDVTSEPGYRFASFSGTVWKTKVNMALADLNGYRGKHGLTLLVPMHFDKSHAEYTPAHDMQIISVFPPGARLRIDRLMKNNGSWGGPWVTVVLDDRTHSQETVRIDDLALAKNRFIWLGDSDSKDWGVNPDMLEK